MSYNYRTSKNLDRILEKLLKKDKALYEQVIKKIKEVINSSDVGHYKNLKYNLSDKKRAQKKGTNLFCPQQYQQHLEHGKTYKGTCS